MRTVEAFVSDRMDNAPITPTHVKVVALVAAGYCIDVIDYAIYGSFIPDMMRQHFATQSQLGWVGGAQLFGLAIGTFAQGKFTDRFGRKAVYQFNLLLSTSMSFSPRIVDFVTQKRPDSLAGLPSWASSS